MDWDMKLIMSIHLILMTLLGACGADEIITTCSVTNRAVITGKYEIYESDIESESDRLRGVQLYLVECNDGGAMVRGDNKILNNNLTAVAMQANEYIKDKY